MEEQYIGTRENKPIENMPNHVYVGNIGLIYTRREDGSYLSNGGRVFQAWEIQHDVDKGCLVPFKKK